MHLRGRCGIPDIVNSAEAFASGTQRGRGAGAGRDGVRGLPGLRVATDARGGRGVKNPVLLPLPGDADGDGDVRHRASGVLRARRKGSIDTAAPTGPGANCEDGCCARSAGSLWTRTRMAALETLSSTVANAASSIGWTTANWNEWCALPTGNIRLTDLHCPPSLMVRLNTSGRA